MRTYPERHGIELLLSQYRNSPNLIKYIEVFLTEFNLLEVVFRSIETARRLARARGVQLDDIAYLVGTSRIIYGAASLGYFGYYDNAQALGINVGVFKSEDGQDAGDLTLTDGQLRNRIRARIIKTMGNSCIDDVLDFCDLLLGRELDIEITETTAACNLQYHGTLGLYDKSLLANILPDIKPIGVSFTLADDAGVIDIAYDSKDYPVKV